MKVPVALLALASSCCTALAFDLKGRILWNDVCSSLGELGQASVVLDHGRLRGGVTRDGGFTIPDVPAGTYILSVLAHDHAFDQLRIDVPANDSSAAPEVRPYTPGTPLDPAAAVQFPYPPLLTPRARHDYFVPPEAFNLLGMFQNPMMLLSVGGGALMLLMPYLMKNMDPETLQEIQGRQARINSIQSSIQSGDIRTGISELLSAGDEANASAKAAASGAAKGASTGARGRGGKNVHRRR
ncbi:hypothetical protein SCP_0112780 [Sparassis crispa]|uniref:ER membrane protein complex subunit 7 beta-sandwich domain-containing protein n=1 Tax=Sparassis crispa TaxID=139825 RepID=A0A401G8D6_9APHY|nr:hypothetical protein SCP_0112780 [Sparassis crispa]GBE78393.1 hypothetical protein SCP_0112780 [Sparassis crispa]